MGHANFTNISKVVNRLLKRVDGATINEIAEELLNKKQTVHASEGEYDKKFMLKDACMEIINILEKDKLITPRHPLNGPQIAVYQQWRKDSIDTWDCGDDGEGGEYAIFDSIRWLALRKKLPIIRYFTR